MKILDIVLFASGSSCVGQVLVEVHFTGVSLAGGQLDPLGVFGLIISKLDDLNVRWVLRVLVDLHQLVVVLRWPLVHRCAAGLAMAVPVTVWSIASVCGLCVTILVLRHLVLSIQEWRASLHHIVVDLWWRPVGVVRAPLRLVGLLSGGWRRRSSGWVEGWWHWSIWIIALAGGNDGIAQIVLQRNIGVVESSSFAVWELHPLSLALCHCLSILPYIIAIVNIVLRLDFGKVLDELGVELDGCRGAKQESGG